jgi:hypothetical protein
MSLRNFLVWAKKQGYASDAEYSVLENGIKEFSVINGDFTYKDRYVGSDPFHGTELVLRRGKPVWVMSYQGGLVSGFATKNDVYSVLKIALEQVTEELPFRGPETLSIGAFEYVNHVLGTISLFKGTERIFFRGQEVYTGDYMGRKL